MGRSRYLTAIAGAIFANHRRIKPFGLNGGEAGQVGVNRVERLDGQVETLASCASALLHCGDTFIIETPGGGGFGPCEKEKTHEQT